MKNLSKPKNMVDCFFADLTHTKQGVQAKCFPLGTGLVAEYTRQELGDVLNVELYKYPDELEKSLKESRPKILALSNYSWNQELGYTLAKAYKRFNQDAIIIVGGPNFPYSESERQSFLEKYNIIDFYIFGEGEVAFVNLVKKIIDNNYSIENLKSTKEKIDNCAYLYDKKVYYGSYVRTKNLQKIPSPYLSGSFDEYFEDDLMPLYETARGCPFSCTFCSDGVKDKTMVYRYTKETIDENLEYIAKNKKKTDSLFLSDLNFGMYAEDIDTCKKIVQTKEKYGFPIFFGASAGKSNFQNILNSLKVLDGIWSVGASVQSTDAGILKHIKRKNLPYDKMIELANSAKEKGSLSYTEIILALPEDSKEKHFTSLKKSIDAGMDTLKMFQLMLLTGTEMSSEYSRNYYAMEAKYRVMPGAAGEYAFFDETYKIAEFEQIVVSNKTLSYEDYLECRVMNLLVEIFINNGMFNELYLVLDYYNISKFDTLEYIKNNTDLYTKEVKRIFESFIKDTKKDLFDTYDEITEFINKEGVIEKHISGELGNNEILDHRALSYIEYKDFIELLYSAIVNMLKNKGCFSSEIDDVLKELKDFIVVKNSTISSSDLVIQKTFNYDFENLSSKKFNDILDSKNSGLEYSFYHSDEQKSMIKKLYKIYNGNTIAGLGRLIQKNDMSLLYRKFRKTSIDII